MASEAVIRVSDLNLSRYGIELIKGLSFDTMRGEIFGLAGTERRFVKALILMLGGYLKPDKGELKFAGIVSPEAGRKEGKIACYVSKTSYPPKMKVIEILELSGMMFVSDSKRVRDKVEELASLFNLKEALSMKWESLDESAKEAVSILACLMSDAEYLILDSIEHPPNGFENLLRNYLVSLAGIGKTILISTDRPEGLCDVVLILRSPTSYEIGKPEYLTRKYLGFGTIDLLVSRIPLIKIEEALLKANCSWHYLTENRLAITVPASPMDADYIISEIVRNGGRIEEIKMNVPEFRQILGLREEVKPPVAI